MKMRKIRGGAAVFATAAKMRGSFAAPEDAPAPKKSLMQVILAAMKRKKA